MVGNGVKAGVRVAVTVGVAEEAGVRVPVAAGVREGEGVAVSVDLGVADRDGVAEEGMAAVVEAALGVPGTPDGVTEQLARLITINSNSPITF